MSDQEPRASEGIGLGVVIAVVMSWSANHSIGWAILHGLCGWLYVGARIVGCAGGEP